MGFTYGQLLAQQRQHSTKITHILEGKAFATTWAHSGQVVRYLFAKLKETEHRESLAIASEAWGLHAGEAVRNVMAEEASHREDFPYEAFTDFLGNMAQEKFLLPIMLRNNHFAGLCLEKKLPAEEGSSNAAIMLELKYVDPKGSAIEPENSNKDLAAIKAKLAEILQECCDANSELRDKHYQIGSEYNLSCEQQITDCDCAYITAQNLLDFAAGRADFTCPNYQSDPEFAIMEIARLRGEFVDPDIMGAGNVEDYLAQEMLDMLKGPRYDKVSDYIKTTGLEQLQDTELQDYAELFHQLKMLFEENAGAREITDYLKEHQHECLALLLQLESKLMAPELSEKLSAQLDFNSQIFPSEDFSQATSTSKKVMPTQQKPQQIKYLVNNEEEEFSETKDSVDEFVVIIPTSHPEQLSKFNVLNKLKQLHLQQVTEKLLTAHKSEANLLQKFLEYGIRPDITNRLNFNSHVILSSKSEYGYAIEIEISTNSAISSPINTENINSVIGWFNNYLTKPIVEVLNAMSEVKYISKIITILPENIKKDTISIQLRDLNKLELQQQLQASNLAKKLESITFTDKLKLLEQLVLQLNPINIDQLNILEQYLNNYDCKIDFGNYKIVTRFEPKLVNKLTGNDEPLIYHAVNNGEYALTKILLKAGIDVNKKYHDKTAEMILSLACQKFKELVIRAQRYEDHDLTPLEQSEYHDLQQRLMAQQEMINLLLYHGGYIQIVNQTFSELQQQQLLSNQVIKISQQLCDMEQQVILERQRANDDQILLTLDEVKQNLIIRSQQLQKILTDINVIIEQISQEQWQEWQEQQVNEALLATAIQQQIDRQFERQQQKEREQSYYPELPEQLYKQYEIIYNTFYKLLAGQLHSKLTAINNLSSELLLPQMKQPFLLKIAKLLLPGSGNIINVLNYGQMIKIITEAQKKILYIYSNEIQDKVIEDYIVKVIEFLGEQIISNISGEEEDSFTKIVKFSQKLAKLGQEPRAVIELQQHWQKLSQKYVSEFIIKLVEISEENQSSTNLGQIIAEEVTSKWHQLSLAPVLKSSFTHRLQNAALMASLSELVYQDPHIIKTVIQEQWQQPYYQLVGIKDSIRSIIFGNNDFLITVFKDEDEFKHIIDNGDKKQVIKIQDQELKIHMSLYRATQQLWEGVRVVQASTHTPIQAQPQPLAPPQAKLYAMKEFLETYFGREGTNKESTKLFFAGHSSGGAIANIVALLTMDEFNIRKDQLEIYSYGQPKWCSQKSAAKVQAIFGNQSMRFNNKEDMVPSLPPKTWGFVHPQGEYQFNNEAITFQEAQDARGNFISGVKKISKNFFKKLPLMLVTQDIEWLNNFADPITRLHSNKNYADMIYKLIRQQYWTEFRYELGGVEFRSINRFRLEIDYKKYFPKIDIQSLVAPLDIVKFNFKELELSKWTIEDSIKAQDDADRIAQEVEVAQYLVKHGATIQESNGEYILYTPVREVVRSFLGKYDGISAKLKSDGGCGYILSSRFDQKSKLIWNKEERVVTSKRDNINLQEIYLLNLYYQQKFAAIITYVDEHSVMTELPFIQLLKVWSCLKLAKFEVTEELLETININSIKFPQFDKALYHYIKAEYYFKIRQYNLALTELERIEEENPLISPALLREYIKFKLGEIDYDLNFESLQKPYLADCDLELLSEFRGRIELTPYVRTKKAFI